MEKHEYQHERAKVELKEKRKKRAAAKRECMCGEREGLSYFRGGYFCRECLNADFETPTVETMARDRSMMGSGLERVQEIW